MTAVLVLIGLVLLGAGALALGSPDTMWAVTRFRNRAEGLASERTETWEGFNKWGGVFSIALGVLSLVGAVGTGIAAHGHAKQLALLDDIGIDCTPKGVVLSNVGNGPLQVKLGRLRAVAGDVESDDLDYGPRDVLEAPETRGFVPLPVDGKHADVTLAPGKADRVPVTIPSDAHCKTDMPALFGGPGCHSFEFQLTVARPGKTGKTLWRHCSFQP